MERGAMGIDELFDLQAVGELATLHRTQGEESMRALLELFAAEAHRALVRMRVSAWMGDAAALLREAHRLKASSGSFGAKRLEAECLALERCARDGKPGAFRSVEQRVEQALSVLQFTREGIRSPRLFHKAGRCSNIEAAT